MKAILASMCAVACVAILMGCGSGPRNADPKVDQPQNTPQKAANSMVGPWRAEALPARFQYVDMPVVFLITKSEFEFREDGTFRYAEQCENPDHNLPNKDYLKPYSVEGFYRVEGRRLTIELPGSVEGKRDVMLAPDLKSFAFHARNESFALTFRKQ
jgi:hypothetical protein